MTQHEYIFIAVSIILGLAITRLLSNAAMLLRGREKISFHWSSAIWAFSIMLYILQLWWVGWGCGCLRNGSSRTSSFWCLAALVFMGHLKWP